MVEPSGSLTPDMDQEVLITNFGMQVYDTPLAALENFAAVQDFQEHFQTLFEWTDLPDAEDRIAIWGLLADFADVFIGPDRGEQLGPTKIEPHRIDTGMQAPVKQWPYCMFKEGHCIVEKECQKMLEKGVIKESNSPWSSPVVLVAKKNGDVRFCVDYRRLNSLTWYDSYPLLNVYDILGALDLRGCKYFCTMDLASGFWQIPMTEEGKMLDFPTRTGH
jgi:hypothetical protein